MESYSTSVFHLLLPFVKHRIVMLMKVPLLIIALEALAVHGKCQEPSPAFPVPNWQERGHQLHHDLHKIEHRLKALIDQDKYNATSYSVEVTSSSDTIWSSFHTAKVQNESRPGDQHVDGDSQYRIASISKTFTTLALLYQNDAGNLSLDDPVTTYIPELKSNDFKLPFKDISLRILASQLSGIPREVAQSDLANAALHVQDPTALGLPTVSRDGLPTCDEYVDYARPCNRTDFFARVKQLDPLFAPNQKSTYSNINYELLGIVLENVTGMKYKDYIQNSIFEPLEMTSSSLDKPSDEHAVLPVLRKGHNYWDVQEGVQNPTGGIYSSSSDISKFMRYILTHFNSITTGVNWFMPASWGTGMNTFYGMPFETFRTDKILEQSRRPITFVTKSGGLPGYYSQMMLLEEYGLGLTILVGGEVQLVGEIVEILTVELVNAAERIAWSSVERTYAGRYVATEATLESSMTLEMSASKGLHVTSWISNGTDVLNESLPTIGIAPSSGKWYLQLIPTLLFKDEEKQDGEVWKGLIVDERVADDRTSVWDDFCVTDVDQLFYAGKSVNEVIVWHEKGLVELPGWNLTLRSSSEVDSGKERLIVQS